MGSQGSTSWIAPVLGEMMSMNGTVRMFNRESLIVPSVLRKRQMYFSRAVFCTMMLTQICSTPSLLSLLTRTSLGSPRLLGDDQPVHIPHNDVDDILCDHQPRLFRPRGGHAAPCRHRPQRHRLRNQPILRTVLHALLRQAAHVDRAELRFSPASWRTC